MRAEAWHSVSVQSARRLWQTYPMKLDWYRTRRGTVKISVVSRCHAEALRREQHGDNESLRSTQQVRQLSTSAVLSPIGESTATVGLVHVCVFVF